ncbi:hypothetical protein Tco_1354239 [Tanacetum coccineum]
MCNEPRSWLAHKEGADDSVVYYDVRSKDLEACLEKERSEYNVGMLHFVGVVVLQLAPCGGNAKSLAVGFGFWKLGQENVDKNACFQGTADVVGLLNH